MTKTIKNSVKKSSTKTKVRPRATMNRTQTFILRNRKWQALIFAVLVAVVGVTALLLTHAAVPGAPRLAVFAVSPNHTLMHKEWDGMWRPWEDLGGNLTDAPAAVSWGADRIDVFGRSGVDNSLQHKVWDGKTWSSWQNLGGVLTSAPTVASWGPNRLDVFVKGTDNALWHLAWNGSNYEPWQSLGGNLKGSPTAVSWGPNRIDVFSQTNTNDDIWHEWYDGQWKGWEDHSGPMASSPAVASWASNRLDIFARGTDNALWHMDWNGSGYDGWQSLGGNLKGSPAAVSWGPNRIDIFSQSNVNDNMMHQWWDGQWHAWEEHSGAIASSPGVAAWSMGQVIAPPAPGVSAVTQAVIQAGRTEIAKNIPYHYGCGGYTGPTCVPAGFDCSAFMQYVMYQGSGLKIPRTSQAQYNATVGQGRSVALSAIKPGDLVFYGTSGSTIHHVAMYIGNNQMMEAPQTGYNIRIATFRTSGLAGIGYFAPVGQ